LPQRGHVFTCAVLLDLEEKLRRFGCCGVLRRTVANEELETFGALELGTLLFVIALQWRYLRAVTH
jgi:hypothetical protein